MKFSRSKILFFVFGLSAFVYLVLRFGLDQIASNITRAGWSLLYIVGVWFIIYLMNTLAWKLVLGESGRKISFVQLFLVTVSGFVINYVTPVVALGGEPYKVSALTRTFGTQKSLSAVVLYRMVHLLGHMFLLLAGVVVALAFLSLPAAFNGGLVVAAAVIAAVVTITMMGQRDGIFGRLHRLLRMLPFLRNAVDRLDRYRDEVASMDAVLTDTYHHQRRKFYTAVSLEFLSRICMGIEVYLILYGIGIPVSLVMALFLYVVYSIIINVLFFIPLNLGAREGGLALGLESLALPPLLGVYLGVVMRIREFVWIMLGLLFIVFTTEKERPPSPNTP